MKITVDGLNFTAVVEEDSRIKNIIDDIAENAGKDERIIAMVEIDGRIADVAEIGDLKAKEVENLDIFTDTPVGLAVKTALDALNFSKRVKSALEKVHSHVSEGEEELGYSIFRECLPGLQWLSTIIPKIFSIMHEIVDENGNSVTVHENFQGALESTLSALEGGDIFELADKLKYELVPVLTDWEEKLALILLSSGADAVISDEQGFMDDDLEDDDEELDEKRTIH